MWNLSNQVIFTWSQSFQIRPLCTLAFPFALPPSSQLDKVECDQSLRMLFSENSGFESIILETGFRKPLSLLVLEDKSRIQEVIKAHVILRVKAELDQFCQGLVTCGIHDAMQNHPTLMAPCFLWTGVDLTPGAVLVLW